MRAVLFPGQGSQYVGMASDFYKNFEWIGVQRHLKILGIFSRLSIRDKKNQYLKDIPLVEKYLLDTSERYKDLYPLRRILDKVVS